MKIKKILLPTDFSEGSKAAIDYAKSLAKHYDAHITLIYVVDELTKTHGWYVPHISVNELYKDIEESAKKQIERCCYEEFRDFEGVEKVVTKGVPGDVIAKYAKEKGIDLIVMGTYSKVGMDLLFGSTAQRVLKKANCPVLCVKLPPEHA